LRKAGGRQEGRERQRENKRKESDEREMIMRGIREKEQRSPLFVFSDIGIFSFVIYTYLIRTSPVKLITVQYFLKIVYVHLYKLNTYLSIKRKRKEIANKVEKKKGMLESGRGLGIERKLI
jgi:hypothetical protein